VISIITVLTALLLTGLAGARNAARAAECLSNQRQLMAAWTSYTIDYGQFVYGEDDGYFAKSRSAWGGVHWYPELEEVPVVRIDARRPLNPYVLDRERLDQVHVPVFKCPSDTQGKTSVNGYNAWGNESEGNVSGEATQSIYGVVGTSYSANAWMYCQPGAPRGWDSNGDPQVVTTMGPQHVAYPSRFLTIGDMAAYAAGANSAAYRRTRDIYEGWWHKYEHGQIAFLDGSARLVGMGAPQTNEYTYWVDPDRHEPGDWTHPYSP